MTRLPVDFDTLPQSLLNRYPNVPIELCYHPGDGSRWAVTVADRTVTGGWLTRYKRIWRRNDIRRVHR